MLLPGSSTFLVLALLIGRNIAKGDPASSTEKDLVYDTNGKLQSHQLFYPADSSENCPVTKRGAAAPYGYTFTALTGNILKSVFPEYEPGSGACPVACVERGTDQSLVLAILPQKKTSSQDAKLFEKWLSKNCLSVDVCLQNYHNPDSTINLWWVDEAEEGHHQLEILYGNKNTHCFRSQIGYRYIVVDGDDMEAIIGDFIIEHALSKTFGEPAVQDDLDGFDFENDILDTLDMNWENHKEVQRTFSPLGFKKGRLPDDVFVSMSAFYYNNRDNYAKEEWTVNDGPYVNWWEADCFFVQIPSTLRLIWQARLRDLVEEWAGVPIEQTDMYGMRQYTQGSRLLTHVDRVSTHAVSLIVNVAQGNLTQPWPVEINDHENRMHQFFLQPGEMLFYESAKCLHGRNQPLQGDNAYYVSLFTHYRPTNDPEWYTKPNPEGSTPGPAESVCNQLDTTDGAQCTVPGSGMAESASEFRVRSAEDLIQWWRLTAEKLCGEESEDG